MKKIILITVAVAMCLGAAGATWFWLFVQAPDARVRNAVRYALSDPESAVFVDLRAVDPEKTFWCGRVNARNKFGGMTGFTAFMVRLPPVEHYRYRIVNRELDQMIATVDILNVGNVDKFLAEDGTSCRSKTTID